MEENNYRIKEEINEELLKKQNDKYSFYLLVASFFTFFFFNPIISVIFSVVAIFGYGKIRQKNIYFIGHILIILAFVLLLVQNLNLYTN